MTVVVVAAVTGGDRTTAVKSGGVVAKFAVPNNSKSQWFLLSPSCYVSS